MTKKIICILLVLFLGITSFLSIKYIRYSNVLEKTVCTTPTPLDSQKLWNLLQTWRIENGYFLQKIDERLCNFASIRAIEVTTNWSHEGLNASRVCPNSYCELGEILVRRQPTEEASLNAWLNSPSHKEIIVFPYTFGCIITNGSYAVGEFGNF